MRSDPWLPEAAPSTALRKWFGHDPSKWETFRERYFAELDERPEVVGLLLEKARQRPLTLLFSAHDAEHDQAVLLREYLLSKPRRS